MSDKRQNKCRKVLEKYLLLIRKHLTCSELMKKVLFQ